MQKVKRSVWGHVGLCALAGTLVGTLAGCSGGGDGSSSNRTFNGSSQTVGNGNAQSFVTLDAGGRPLKVGVKLSASALSGLPDAEADTPFLLPLPAQAAGATIFDHISLDWESHGHDPNPIYGTPHFDVHFYMISDAERDQIAFAPDAPAPAAQFIPPGYQSTQTVVPRMGQHWFDPADPNNAPGQFQHVFLYGFHAGKMVFLEPMITREFLLTETDFSGSVKQPTAYPKPGFYPTRYKVEFNQSDQTYLVTLDQFVQRT
jgi:hypothetical protein